MEWLSENDIEYSVSHISRVYSEIPFTHTIITFKRIEDRIHWRLRFEGGSE
jgi:hypothetical protein